MGHCRELKSGDRIKINDHRSWTDWEGFGTLEQGYIIGLLVGDGTIKKDKAVLSLWIPDAKAAGEENMGQGPMAVMSEALKAVQILPHRSDFKGWIHVKGRNEYRMSTSSIGSLASSLGMSPGNKGVTRKMETDTSSAFVRGFLSGLFDADGSIQGEQEKGISVRLSQSSLPTLKVVQRMLLRLGIASTIYKNRRKAGQPSFRTAREA